MGSGGGEEGRDSGKMDRVEQVVMELVMKDGEDLNREEEDKEVVTGEDLLAEEIMQVNTAGFHQAA